MNKLKIFSWSLLALLSCGGSATTEDTDKPYNEAVCFVYHRFGDSRFPTTNVSTKDFEAHLSYLVENDFSVLTFSQALQQLKSEESVQKIAVITIDDGYKSFFENGLPLLKKYKLPATLFINTETVGGNDYMDWNELAQVGKAGIEIGNHTHTHAYFLNQDPSTRYKTFSDEIKLSQKIIADNLRVTPSVFAYPYGEFDEQMKRIVQREGFVGAAAQNSGVINSESDFFQCPRFPMAEAYASKDAFREKANMRALRIISEKPNDFVLPANDLQPTLTLAFHSKGLQSDRLQCFVQGSTCKFKILNQSSDEITITLQSEGILTFRRRTLYTLTIPDESGNWYWFSHLWINPNVP